MELPKTIRIGVADYEVLRKKKPKMDDSGEVVMGWFKTTEQQICVGTAISDIRQLETFVHEILHVVMSEAGLSEQAGDHSIIDPLTISLMHFLMQNDLAWINNFFKDKWHERHS